MTFKVAQRSDGVGVLILVLLTSLVSGCATQRPAPTPPVGPAPTPTSTTTCFQLRVYDPATRQYEYQQICSTDSTPQNTPKLD